jgi:hypothetical protein
MGNIGKRPELKRKQICLFYLVMCFVSLFLMVKATDAMLSQQSGISEMSRADKEYASKIVFCKKFGISVDDAKNIEAALNSIGVESVTDATKDEKGMYSLNVTAKGGYTHLFLDKDNKVETIKLKEIIMYKDGQAVHQPSDYVLSVSEENQMERQSKEMVKKVLKAPTTAEFDYKTFRYFKLNGIGIIIGTVDSQNSFGAMIRSNFKVQFDCNDNMKPIHMSFEGNEIF